MDRLLMSFKYRVARQGEIDEKDASDAFVFQADWIEVH